MKVVPAALVVLLTLTPSLTAQQARELIDDAMKQTGWTEQFQGDLGTMIGWIVGGSLNIDKGELLLGGAAVGTLGTPGSPDLFGDEFKLLIEYRVDGPPGHHLILEQHGFFGMRRSERSMPAQGGGDWTRMLLVQERDPNSGGLRLTQAVDAENMTMTGVIVQGDPVRRLDILVDPGATLRIRRIRLLTTARPASATGSLAGPLVVLGVVLGGVMTVGWLRHRRRATAMALALTFLMVWAGPSSAQPGGLGGKQAPREPGWMDQIGRGAGVLIGWNVRGGQLMDNDGVIHLGGPSPTLARLVTPLSEEFKLFMEYQSPDPQSIRMRFHSQSMFTGSAMEQRLSGGGAGQWVELTLSGAPRPTGGYQLDIQQSYRNGQSNAGITRGDAIDFIEIEVPAGQTMAIRRLELLSTAPAATGQSLIPAVAILLAFLLGVMALGWLLNRRRRTALSAGH